MVHVTSGYVDEVTRLTNYTYSKKNGHRPVTPHGTRHSVNGRNTTYSETSKAPKTKTAPVNVAEVHATAYTLATIDYTPIKAEYKARQEKPSKVTINVKVVKARYTKARGAKTEN